MGKKKKEEMAAQRAKFMTGCATNKIPEKKAERIFNLMEEFAGYGFNKSHSCAYALLAYQTAYLKTHYPGGIHGGAADFGNGERRQSGEVHQRGAGDEHFDSAAGRERERFVLYAGREKRFASAWRRSRTLARTPPRRFGSRG